MFTSSVYAHNTVETVVLCIYCTDTHRAPSKCLTLGRCWEHTSEMQDRLLASESSRSSERERDWRLDRSILGLKKTIVSQCPYLNSWQRNPFTGCFQPLFPASLLLTPTSANCYDNGPLHPPPSFLVFVASGRAAPAPASPGPHSGRLLRVPTSGPQLPPAHFPRS